MAIAIILMSSAIHAQTNEWTWVSGSNTSTPTGWQTGITGGQGGSYGTQGVPSSANIPGSRSFMTSWTGANGNLWLF